MTCVQQKHGKLISSDSLSACMPLYRTMRMRKRAVPGHAPRCRTGRVCSIPRAKDGAPCSSPSSFPLIRNWTNNALAQHSSASEDECAEYVCEPSFQCGGVANVSWIRNRYGCP
eukprot:2437347-Rhodomonas_salina.2